MNSRKLPTNINEIKLAKQVLEKVINKTPLIKSNYYSATKNASVYLKLENLQMTGSFKFRGAYYKLSTLNSDQRKAGVIACSSGNHAQGVALSAHLLRTKATIVMPNSSPKAKVTATKSYHAEVELFGDIFDEAKERCLAIQAETNETFIHPYDDPQIIAGQGTIGLEILEDLFDVDTVIAPIGGGGLISGIAIALKSYNPNITVIGVQSDNIHGMKASIDNGEITSHFNAASMADGCAVMVPGNYTFDIVYELVDKIITVSEDEIAQAMQNLLQKNKIVVEGAGALSCAAIASKQIDEYITNKKVVAIISGGNVDLERVIQVCDHFYGTEYIED